MPIFFDIDLSNNPIYFLPSKNIQRFFFYKRFQCLKAQKYRRIERVKRPENSKNASLETN